MLTDRQHIVHFQFAVFDGIETTYMVIILLIDEVGIWLSASLVKRGCR